MYSKITEFCKIRNSGSCLANTLEPTNRVSFILGLLQSEGIEYELDIFNSSRPGCNFFNIYLFILKINSFLLGY